MVCGSLDKQKGLGYTLVEMLVVVAIVGIMTFLAYPYVVEWFRVSESKRVESIFRNMLRQARAEVYMSRRNVLVCTINENGVCDRGGKQTLIVFYDDNNNNKKDVDEQAIYQQDWALRYGTIILRNSLNKSYIKFMGDTAKPRGHIGHLSYCSESENARLSFKVIYNMQGNIRTERADLVGRGEIGC